MALANSNYQNSFPFDVTKELTQRHRCQLYVNGATIEFTNKARQDNEVYSIWICLKLDLTQKCTNFNVVIEYHLDASAVERDVGITETTICKQIGVSAYLTYHISKWVQVFFTCSHNS